jgi:hypothetical protein
MGRRRQILVLGSFLASEWRELWQRQQEFSTRLMAHGDVTYVERAAGGTITLSRVTGRLGNLLKARTAPLPGVDDETTPQFLRWVQIPSSSERIVSLNARRVVRRIRDGLASAGASKPDLVYVGAPSEVWAEVLRQLEVPFWYDMPERFLYSETYRTVSRDAMTWMVTNASLVTVDTAVGLSDWCQLRDDIVVVPHGSKEVDFEPDWSRRREHVYYVGSDNPAVDVGFLRATSLAAGAPVRVIGRDWSTDLDSSLELLGWADGRAIPQMLGDAIAGLVPYLLDDFTAGVLPTKIYDYFLSGTPAIASALPSLEGHFGVYVADGTPIGISRALDSARALSADERRELWEFARRNTWGTRFDGVLSALSVRGIDLVD